MYSVPEPNSIPRFISLAGLIGAGKTTLADALGKYYKTHYGIKSVAVHHEHVETNELLPLFYSDMKRWGFLLQVSLLTQRHTQLQQINWSSTKYHIEDRFMDEDHVFATTLLIQGDMHELEFETYQKMVKTYENHVKRPDLIVFLDVSPEKSLERIKSRGRKMEQQVPLEYLKVLYNQYKKFIQVISKKIPVIRVNWEEFQETKDVAKLIMDRWDKGCFNVNE